jgi:replicative DNA helicase
LSEPSLPAAPEIERLILGSILLDGAVMDALRTTIDPSDFSTDQHRRIWRAIGRVYDAGISVERVSVMQNLMDAKELQACGGFAYLSDLDTGVPIGVSLDGHIGALKEKSALRRLILMGDSIVKRCSSGGITSREAQETIASELAGLSVAPEGQKPVSTAELIAKHGIDALLKPRRTEGIRLPWARLNSTLCGLHPGQVIIFAAVTGRGKTSAALQIATHVTRQGKSPLIWTLEMEPRQLFRRIVNQMAHVDSDRSRHGALTADERTREKDAVYWVNDHPLYFDSHSRTVPAFCSSIRQVQQKADIGLIVVDYLQLIRFAGRAESRTREVGENSRSLKLAALDFGIPFLVLSQFSRPNNDKPQTIHSLKESGDIENDADVIIMVNSGELRGEQETPVTFHIGKQREGPAGIDIPMMFHPPSQSFYGVDE